MLLCVASCLSANIRVREQVNEAAEIIYDLVDQNANLIFGAVVDPACDKEVKPQCSNPYEWFSFYLLQLNFTCWLIAGSLQMREISCS